MNFVTNVFAHWAEIVAVATALVVAFDKFAKVTPTTKDDEIVAAVEAALKGVGIDVTAGK